MSDKDDKSEEIKVRVTSEMKKRVQYLAKSAGEGEAFIIREAIRSYLVKDGPATQIRRNPKQPPSDKL